jgi:hypothetical protein
VFSVWNSSSAGPFRLLPSPAFGLCDLGMGTPELGFVCMHELRDLRGSLGLPIERDEHFTADKSISAYARDAREHGRIVT